MNIRLFAVVLAVFASASLMTGATQTTPALAAPIEVTTVKHTSVRIGPMSFTLTEGTKLGVVGRQGEYLVVKFRNSKGTVRTSDTNFDAKTMTVPEIAPEAPPAKSVDIVAAKAPEAAHAGGSSPVAAKATPPRAKPKAGEHAPQATASETASHQERPVYYPPVNN